MNAKKKKEERWTDGQTDRWEGGRKEGEREGGTTQHSSATMGTHSKYPMRCN